MSRAPWLLPLLWLGLWLSGAPAPGEAHRPPPQELNLLSADLFASNASGRDGRIFHFNKEPTDIRVELGFAIPFLSIPVGSKKAHGALVDVNLGALAAGGIFSVASMLFIPHLFDGLSPMVSLGRNGEQRSGLNAVLARVDDALRERNVDAGACARRALCSVVASSFDNLHSGNAGSIDKIVDGVISNEWLASAVRDSSLHEAIQAGRYGGNCSALYNACPLSQKALKNMAANLAKMLS